MVLSFSRTFWRLLNKIMVNFLLKNYMKIITNNTVVEILKCSGAYVCVGRLILGGLAFL